MGLSDFLGLITLQTAVGIALCMSVATYAFYKEWVVPGPRYRAALREIARKDRRVRLWQRLYIVSRFAAEKAASLPELDLDWEECE